MEDTKSPLRPVYVVSGKSLSTPKAELLNTTQCIAQASTVELFAKSAGRSLESYGLIRRTQARFDPALDPTFQKVLELSATNNEMILIDDYVRLIDCRDIDLAFTQAAYLKMHAPNLFSITHGSAVRDIPKKILVLNVGDQARKSHLRSKSIKSGLDKIAEFNDGPTRKSVEAGVRAKKRIADHRAWQLSKDIERVRLTLSEDSQSNLTALAEALNASGIKTPSGKGAWQGITVKRVLERSARSGDTD